MGMMPMKVQRQYPRVTVTAKGIRWVEQGHPWIYEAEVVSGAEDVERKVEETALISAINDFLSQLSPERRSMFICRYWRTDSVADIAARCGMTPGAVTMTLSRLRAALRKELLKRGFSI